MTNKLQENIRRTERERQQQAISTEAAKLLESGYPADRVVQILIDDGIEPSTANKIVWDIKLAYRDKAVRQSLTGGISVMFGLLTNFGGDTVLDQGAIVLFVAWAVYIFGGWGFFRAWKSWQVTRR